MSAWRCTTPAPLLRVDRRPTSPHSSNGCGALVARGQVEMLGGGMSSRSSCRCRIAIAWASWRACALTSRAFRRRAHGAWLAERVWEPSVPFDWSTPATRTRCSTTTICVARRCAEDDDVGHLHDRRPGPAADHLRHGEGPPLSHPWQPVRRSSSPTCATRPRTTASAWGSWATTARSSAVAGHVRAVAGARRRGSIRCFSALEENSAWLTTVTPSDWMAAHPPIGRIYVPTASYVEMTEWVLPAGRAPIFARAVARRRGAELSGGPLPARRHVAQLPARYREVNDLHKQMLRVSTAVEACRSGAARERALDHLYRGQSNDCYWHGLFGGIYLVHMRMATLAELIAAEDLVLGEQGLCGRRRLRPGRRDEIVIGTRRADCAGRRRGGGGHRLVGPARVARRAGVRAAPPAGGVPREAARGGGTAAEKKTRRERHAQPARDAPPRSLASPSCSSTTTTSGAAAWSASVDADGDGGRRLRRAPWVVDQVEHRFTAR